ncbi:hypothetical protein EVG20_g6272 [Dentipellis fragilis]|uniref:DNA polymerase epsilon catalytic subunit n=1 Tax=Dentipellis fragilis TaxID=205917 RepID=A0A4Y9YPV5_9AGAM|nr:hypothetical protein EVG20_g6272 [Dentipellis fragilis]
MARGSNTRSRGSFRGSRGSSFRGRGYGRGGAGARGDAGLSRDDEGTMLAERFEQVRVSDEIDEKMGFARVQEGARREGWLINMHPTLVKDADWPGGKAAVDFYFIQDDGGMFKCTMTYEPYFYIGCVSGTETTVEEWLIKKYEGVICRIGTADYTCSSAFETCRTFSRRGASSCRSRSSNLSSSGLSIFSEASAGASSVTSASTAPCVAEVPVPAVAPKLSRRERARMNRILIDKSKTQVQNYDGGKTKVLTGGVMFCAKPKAAPAQAKVTPAAIPKVQKAKATKSDSASANWRAVRA